MNAIDAEFIPQIWKLLPVCLSVFGAGLSFVLYTFGTRSLYRLKISFLGRKFYNFLNKKWFFDKVYNEYIVQSFLSFGYHISYKTIDRGFIELLGPFGFSKLISVKAGMLQKLQTGFLYHYALVILVSITVLLGVIDLWSFLDLFIQIELVYVMICTGIACKFLIKITNK
jgi:NADH-ubiquinone oxidoreductase chain 5